MKTQTIKEEPLGFYEALEERFELAKLAHLSQVEVFSASELLQHKLRPLEWTVERLLPEGCVLFAGRPKVGKSWFAYQLAIAVAAGGQMLGRNEISCGDVLYLALEDSFHRLQSRMNLLLKGAPIPERLNLSVNWPKLDDGGLWEFERWLKLHPYARLIIIDTFQRIKSKHLKGAGTYENDYDSLSTLVDLAHRAGITVLVVHHTRKTNAEDAFDAVSGSTGLTGAVDATMILKRIRGRAEAELHITGRDVEETEQALRFDSGAMRWNLLGEADEIKQSAVRTEILGLLAGWKDRSDQGK